MQQLEQRTLTNTPTDASQVRGNCGLSLNKEETLSVIDLKTCANNPDVNLSQQTGRLNAIVFVLSIDGKPLMPCKPAKAKKLLKTKRAKVAKLYPFTIQLNFECENQVQEVEMGIDTGFGNIGFSCIAEEKELSSGTVMLDGRTSERLTIRKMYRRNRRNKLWYRESRFNNRSRKEGWLPPSTQRRYDAHLKLIKLYQSILPISKVILEIANFDIQKIENPDIEGVGYQEGDMYGYQNMRSYLMAREKGLCQLCKKEFSKASPSHIHHCKERSKQGSNRAKNLAILHKKCHAKLHKKKLNLSAPKSYKQSTFMSIIRNKFFHDLPSVDITYGYITFVNRNTLGLEKTHYNDAFVIAGGCSQQRCETIVIRQKHRNNRAIQMNRKGFAPCIRRQKYAINPKDFVWIDGKKYVAYGIHSKGKYLLIGETKKSISIKKVTKIYNFGSFAFNSITT